MMDSRRFSNGIFLGAAVVLAGLWYVAFRVVDGALLPETAEVTEARDSGTARLEAPPARPPAAGSGELSGEEARPVEAAAPAEARGAAELPGTLAVEVLSAGAPAPDFLLQIVDAETRVSIERATTDFAGRASVTLRPGTYRVTASPPRAVPPAFELPTTSGVLRVSAERRTEALLEPVRGGRLVLEATLADGSAAEVRATLRDPFGGTPRRLIALSTTADGALRLESDFAAGERTSFSQSVPEGTYELVLEGEGFERTARQVVVRAARDEHVRVELVPVK